ncbi:MAG TPA: AMP-binding protein [Acidimicrobiales bacterium]|nr:AMP-binding protein [Acidimicrobiales bacterium]
MSELDAYLQARDGLLAKRADYVAAADGFRWPRLERFNWALDFFDVVPPRDRVALIVASEAGATQRRTYGELSARSDQVAAFLRSLGVGRGDAVLVSLGNTVALWETMLAAMKLGAVVIPASTLLAASDLADRVTRGGVRAAVVAAELAERFAPEWAPPVRVAVGEPVDGWVSFAASAEHAEGFEPDGPTSGDDPLLLYFTSGTTATPKLVLHTHTSYPVGHLTTLYALGLQPGDVHLNISSPGWAKHAWSSFFVPWTAEATLLAFDYARFEPAPLLDVLVDQQVTTFCAPPTVWRMLVQQDLASHPVRIREALSAGEPLNPEVIEQVERAWGVTIRDFFGQTETTALVGNTPGQPVKAGSMGRPLPGYDVVILDADGNPADEGEVCVALAEAPVGIMAGYRDDPAKTAEVTRDGYFHTGDAATRDAEGYITYVGRMDDVFKASDYRLSPFELESVLVEHPAVAEAAVVPSPDRRRNAVPKAFVVLADGRRPEMKVAESILAHCRARLAPYKRIRRIEFAELPKTISGKIRRVELRAREMARGEDPARAENEFWEQDFTPSGAPSGS